jgi:hypothetical protein
MQNETLQNAQNWFDSMGYEAEIKYGFLYLNLDCFSVQISSSEIQERADQWIYELNREN